MADPVELYDRGTHIGFRVVTGAFAAIATAMMVAIFIENVPKPIAWIAPSGFALFFLIIYRIVWRTLPVLGEREFLLVGRRARRRRIPYAEIVSVDRPMWAYSDFAVPHEIVLRNGDSLTFFPVGGALDYLAARRASTPR
jgi:hypothetical protein